MKEIGDSISFRLRGHKSNRDGIGAAITVEAGTLRQTKYLQAGSGFLSQHSKELVLRSRQAQRRRSKRPFAGRRGYPDLRQLPAKPPDRNWGRLRNPFRAEPYSHLRRQSRRHLQLPSPWSWPSEVETWLIQPLKAPEFSLPDLNGNLRTLTFFSGMIRHLLTFWSTAARSQPRTVQRLDQALRLDHIKPLAYRGDQYR